MNTHSIELDGYYARSRGSSTIYLGTAGSHGNEQLQVTQGKGWEGLTIQVVFHPSKVAVHLPANGLLDVPWEATAQPLSMMQGRIVFQGFDQDRLVNSTDLAYTVASHSPALGRDEEPYTPGIVEGVLNQMAADKDAILQAAQQTGQAKDAAAASADAAAGSAAKAQQNAGAANTSAGQAAASASQAAGSAAAAGETLTQVQTAGQEAQQKVKDAETEALDKIAAAAPALPAVSSDTAWQSVTVKPDGSGYNLAALAPIEATIRPTITGNPAVCENSAPWGLQGLKIYGKSVQNGTPSPEHPVLIVSTGDEGSVEIAVTGANLFNKTEALSGWIDPATGNALSSNLLGDADNFYSDYIMCRSGSKIQFSRSSYVIFYDSQKTFIESKSNVMSCTAPERAEFFIVEVSLRKVLVLDAANSFMVNFGDTTLPWELYTGQTIPLSTPNGLPGIPVDSGGNCTDATGQQWICDMIDGALNQNLIKLVFDGSSDEDWTLQSVNQYNIANFRIVLFGQIYEPENTVRFLCNRFVGQTTEIADTQIEGILIAAGNTLYIRVKSDRASNVSDFRAWLNANNVEILVPRATPIVTPFSDEELAAYHALKTHAGTTVVSTAEPIAGMEVQYMMDGNKYHESVDKRLAALEAAQTGI